MKIRKIDIKNFRCYSQTTIELGESSTVLIGKNGSGKSSVLSALKKGLSFIFSHTKGKTNPLKANNNSTVSPLQILDTRYDENDGGFVWPTSLYYEAFFGDEELSWEFLKKNDPGSLHTTKYKDAKEKIMRMTELDQKIWPVYAFFSDSYPHNDINLGKKASKILKSETLPPDFAYYGWDAYQNCNVLWQERYKYIESEIVNRELNVKDFDTAIEKLSIRLDNTVSAVDREKIKKDIESQKEKKKNYLEKTEKKHTTFSTESAYIFSKIMEFTKPLDDSYSFINQEFEVLSMSVVNLGTSGLSVKFLFQDERTIMSGMLPMGYKRLLNIVFDIAYRCFILAAGKYEPGGVVMIDEIELHLHPTLQKEVVHRFKKTFPSIQFIFTTHSPLVITNYKSDDANRIIQLKNDGNMYSNQKVENVYGIDYNIGLTEVMGAKYRASTINNLIDSIVILTVRNRHDDANNLKKELFDIVGENNTLIQKEIDNRIAMNKR